MKSSIPSPSRSRVTSAVDTWCACDSLTPKPSGLSKLPTPIPRAGRGWGPLDDDGDDEQQPRGRSLRSSHSRGRRRRAEHDSQAVIGAVVDERNLACINLLRIKLGGHELGKMRITVLDFDRVAGAPESPLD
jgi:hypothetical protein